MSTKEYRDRKRVRQARRALRYARAAARERRADAAILATVQQ